MSQGKWNLADVSFLHCSFDVSQIKNQKASQIWLLSYVHYKQLNSSDRSDILRIYPTMW